MHNRLPVHIQVPDLWTKITCGNLSVQFQVLIFDLKIPAGQVQVDPQVNFWHALLAHCLYTYCRAIQGLSLLHPLYHLLLSLTTLSYDIYTYNTTLYNIWHHSYPPLTGIYTCLYHSRLPKVHLFIYPILITNYTIPLIQLQVYIVTLYPPFILKHTLVLGINPKIPLISHLFSIGGRIY